MAGWGDIIRGFLPRRGVLRSLADFRTGRELLIWTLMIRSPVALFILHVTYRGKTDALTEPGLYLFAAGIAGIALAQILIGDAALRLRGRGIVEYSD